MTFEQTYDLDVVVLSVLFAMAAVYAAIHMTAPGSRACMWRRIVWLAAPVAILGGGLRIAHDFGLHVFGSQILYHYSTVLVVTLAAVVSSTVAIGTVGRENAARANAARFETSAEAIPQIIWIANSSGRTTYINKRWFQMTGTSEQDAADGGWINEVHPDDRAPLSEKWQACVQSGETFEIEYRLHDATHGYRWYLDLAVPLRDEKGAIQQWFGTCTDIEEQINHSSSSRLKSAPKNWPTPISACSRRCGKRISRAGLSMNTTKR
jgi:PAS domain S-box-containing protein